MVSIVDAAVREFKDKDKSIVSLNKSSLLENGEWKSDEQLLVEKVRKQFSRYNELVSDGEVRIPLHETNSAELTGEYIVYSGESLIPCYVYHETSSGNRSRIDIDEINHTQIAWQIRFWTNEYEPEEQPSYIKSKDGDSNIMSENTTTKIVRPVGEETYDEIDFFENLQQSISEQKDMARDEQREAYSMLSFDVFQSNHGGIETAVPLNSDTNSKASTYSFAVPGAEDNIPSRFRIYPDNEVMIDITEFGHPRVPSELKETDPIEAEVTDVGNGHIEVTLIDNRNSQRSVRSLNQAFESGESSVRIVPLFNPIPFNREVRAVHTTRRAPKKRDVLVGDEPVSFAAKDQISASFDGLNDYQEEAAIQALRADSVSLIHGPPGTGKTRTLIALIRYFVNQGKRVLACAHSNQAVDNLVIGSSSLRDTDENSLHYNALRDEMTISRVGQGARDDLVEANYGHVNSAKADVVASTMSGAEQFSIDSFDVAVVDEASQASIPSTLIPFNAAEKTILAGDHKQLPPYASDELQQGDMEISLFEHLINRYGEDIRTMLQTQYRMNEQIAEFPSEAFYDGELETADINRSWTLGGLSPVLSFNADGVEEPTRGKSYKNTVEAAIVADQVDAIHQFGVELDDVGVITAYAGQIGPIRDALDSLEIETSGVKVDTVDSFQGSEREAIIVSFVRSNDDGNTGFLSLPDEGKRRLNVALTRAKKRIVLIGNWDTLTSEQNGREDCSQTYRELHQWLQENATVRDYKPTKKHKTNAD